MSFRFLKVEELLRNPLLSNTQILGVLIQTKFQKFTIWTPKSYKNPIMLSFPKVSVVKAFRLLHALS